MEPSLEVGKSTDSQSMGMPSRLGASDGSSTSCEQEWNSARERNTIRSKIPPPYLSPTISSNPNDSSSPAVPLNRWRTLPTRLTLFIFSMLDTPTLLTTRLVCKRWEHHSAQHTRLEMPEQCTDVQFKMLLAIFPNVKTIVLPSAWNLTKKGWLPLLEFEREEDNYYNRAMRWPPLRKGATFSPYSLSIAVDARKTSDANSLFWLAARLHRIQARNAAISVCSRGLELNSAKQVEFLRRRATLYQQMKMWQEALADFETLLALLRKDNLNDEIVPALRQKSYVLQKMDRNDEALAVVNETIAMLRERRPEGEQSIGSDVRFDRAIVLCRLRLYEAALQDLEKCINTMPVNVDVFAKCYQLRADVKAFLASKATTNSSSSSTPSSQQQECESSPFSAFSPTASSVSTPSTPSPPSPSSPLSYSSPLHNSSATLSVPSNQQKTREDAVCQANRYRKRARINYTLRRYEEAIEDCKAAIQFAPCSGDFKLWSVWTGSLLHLRLFTEALEMSAKALECAQPGTSDWCLAIADRVDVLLGLNRAQEGLDLTDRVMETQPIQDQWLVLSARARAQVSMGLHETALQEINAILTRSPEDVHGLRRRIVVLCDMGRLEEALNETLLLLQLLNREELKVSRFRREETRNWANSMYKCLRHKTCKERRRQAAISGSSPPTPTTPAPTTGPTSLASEPISIVPSTPTVSTLTALSAPSTPSTP